MDEFKKQVKNLDPEIYKKINKLLEEHGASDMEVKGLKLTPKSQALGSCPPGYKMYCYPTSDGKYRCRCIKI